MPTLLTLGAADHGRALTGEEFLTAEYERGYEYELIGGKLHVSPAANPPQDELVVWLHEQLLVYKRRHPEVINYVSQKSRVILADEEVTWPEPDLAAYHDYPLRSGLPKRWQEVNPVLVVEVLSEGDPGKDLERNVGLYLRVPSIREYWVLDPREDYNRPALLVHRRRGGNWQRTIHVAGGDTYTTRLLPDFALVLDVHR